MKDSLQDVKDSLCNLSNIFIDKMLQPVEAADLVRLSYQNDLLKNGWEDDQRQNGQWEIGHNVRKCQNNHISHYTSVESITDASQLPDQGVKRVNHHGEGQKVGQNGLQQQMGCNITLH